MVLSNAEDLLPSSRISNSHTGNIWRDDDIVELDNGMSINDLINSGEIKSSSHFLNWSEKLSNVTQKVKSVAGVVSSAAMNNISNLLSSNGAATVLNKRKISSCTTASMCTNTSSGNSEVSMSDHNIIESEALLSLSGPTSDPSSSNQNQILNSNSNSKTTTSSFSTSGSQSQGSSMGLLFSSLVEAASAKTASLFNTTSKSLKRNRSNCSTVVEDNESESNMNGANITNSQNLSSQDEDDIDCSDDDNIGYESHRKMRKCATNQNSLSGYRVGM